jgi:hypothetical protein
MTELVSILGVHLFTISDFFYSIERPFERSQNTLQFKESNCPQNPKTPQHEFIYFIIFIQYMSPSAGCGSFLFAIISFFKPINIFSKV